MTKVPTSKSLHGQQAPVTALAAATAAPDAGASQLERLPNH